MLLWVQPTRGNLSVTSLQVPDPYKMPSDRSAIVLCRPINLASPCRRPKHCNDRRIASRPNRFACNNVSEMAKLIFFSFAGLEPNADRSSAHGEKSTNLREPIIAPVSPPLLCDEVCSLLFSAQILYNRICSQLNAICNRWWTSFDDGC